MAKPKILVFDIETAPILAYVWGLWENNVGLNQIHSDWYVLSWAAKWLGDPASKIMYQDQRHAKRLEDDHAILKAIWSLLDQADIVITQNGKSFDSKKLHARFVLNGMKPPSTYRHLDTKIIAKKHFAFTSNKLDYMTDKLCKKHKKLKHTKFPGFELWRECLLGNQKAWREMELYNKRDVLSTEELYTKLIPWDSSINFGVYGENLTPVCSCGCNEFMKRGFFFTTVGKFQRLRCRKCGKEMRDRQNLMHPVKKSCLSVGTK